MSSRRIAVAAIGCLLATLPAATEACAESVSLPAVADTGLREVLPNVSGGADAVLRAGTTASMSTNSRARALFLFDPAGAIPPGSIITAAQLTLTVTATTDTLPRSFDLRRMLAPWSESDATWLIRLAPSVPWESPGGLEGVDYSVTASATNMVGNAGAYSWGSTTGVVADVQRWIDNPAKNFGWMLVRPEETTPRTTRVFTSREGATGQPLLTVEFTTPLRITSTQIADHQLCLQFRAEAGKAYVVERRGQVETGAWTIVTNFPPADATVLVTVCDPVAPTNLFYRVGSE
jgi:hypothetical protein